MDIEKGEIHMDNYGNQPYDQSQEIGWDDEIKKEKEYVLLPEGNYNFTINKVVKGRHEGSAYMPACNKAILTLMIDFEGRPVPVPCNLFLQQKAEWKLSEFFTSIGLKKKNVPFVMKWNIEGLKGRCEITHRQYDGKTFNNVSKFYAPGEEENKHKQVVSTQQTSYQQPQQTYQQTSYQQPQSQPQTQQTQPQGNWNANKGW